MTMCIQQPQAFSPSDDHFSVFESTRSYKRRHPGSCKQELLLPLRHYRSRHILSGKHKQAYQTPLSPRFVPRPRQFLLQARVQLNRNRRSNVIVLVAVNVRKFPLNQISKTSSTVSGIEKERSSFDQSCIKNKSRKIRLLAYGTGTEFRTGTTFEDLSTDSNQITPLSTDMSSTSFEQSGEMATDPTSSNVFDLYPLDMDQSVMGWSIAEPEDSWRNPHASQKRKRASGNVQKTGQLGGRRFGYEGVQDPQSFREADEDDNEDEEDEEGPPSSSQSTIDSTTELGRLLRCPFNAYDPIRFSEQNLDELHYHNCASDILRDISRVKLHLERIHVFPQFFCQRCHAKFRSQVLLDQHRQPLLRCEMPRPDPLASKISRSKFNEIRNLRNLNAPIVEKYNAIYRILFPTVPLPSSPFVGEGPDPRFDFFRREVPRRAVSNLLREQLILDIPQAHLQVLNCITAVFDQLQAQTWTSRSSGSTFGSHRPSLGTMIAEAEEHDEQGSDTMSEVQNQMSGLSAGNLAPQPSFGRRNNSQLIPSGLSQSSLSTLRTAQMSNLSRRRGPSSEPGTQAYRRGRQQSPVFMQMGNTNDMGQFSSLNPAMSFHPSGTSYNVQGQSTGSNFHTRPYAQNLNQSFQSFQVGNNTIDQTQYHPDLMGINPGPLSASFSQTRGIQHYDPDINITDQDPFMPVSTQA